MAKLYVSSTIAIYNIPIAIKFIYIYEGISTGKDEYNNNYKLFIHRLRIIKTFL